MVNTVSGGAQQPFGTLYQPGGAVRGDSRVSGDPSSRTKDKEAIENKKIYGSEARAEEKSGKPEEKTAASYKSDSSSSSGNGQRGQLVNITA